MPFYVESWPEGEVGRLARLLQRETRFLEQVLDAIPVAVAVCSTSGDIRFSNSALRRLCSDFDGLRATVRPAVQRLVSDGASPKGVAVQGFTPAAVRLYALDLDHALLVAENHCSAPVADAAAAAVPVVAADTGTLDLVTAPVLLIGVHTEVLFANAAAINLFGYTATEITSLKYANFDSATPQNTVVSEGHFRAVMQTKSGRSVPVEIGSRAATYRGAVARVLTLEVPPKATAANAECMAPLERMAGQLAHRLNNLLTVVLSYADLMSSQYGGVEALGADLKMITEAAESASRIADELLTFSRGRPTAVTVVEVDKFLVSMSSMLRSVGERAPVHILPNAPGARVRFGQKELETVVLNLVKNAKEAVQSSAGTITLRTSRLNPEEPEDLFLFRQFDLKPVPQISLAVIDGGPRFPIEHGHAVFEPFFTTKNGALGMGLSTVYGMVKRAGGVVSIERPEYGGTLVRVLLPEYTNSAS